MNIMNYKIFSILIIAATFSACERNILELPENNGGENSDPVFRLEMNIDNTDLEVIAGEEDIFNHTDYLLDQDEVFTFQGLLATDDCADNCQNAYRFKFRNFEAEAESVNVNQSLSPKSYKYKYDLAPTQDAIELHMNINTQAQDPLFTWKINTENHLQNDLSDIFIINIDDNERDSAILTIIDEATGLRSFSEQQIHLDESINGVKSSFRVTQIEEDSVLIELIHSESDFPPLEQTFWAIDDLSGGLTTFPDQLKTELPLRIGNGKRINNDQQFLNQTNGSRTKTSMEIKYDPVLDQVIYHDADFDYNIEKRIAQGSDLALQTFEFEMYDESGVLFSSAKGEQTEGASFEILSLEPFIENADGQATVKVTCQFSCRVFSDDGDSKTINDANAVIAVAIP